MLGIDDRALRVVWTVFLFALLLAILFYIRDTLLIFALSIVFAYVLSPLVTLIERFTPARRKWALGLVYVLFIGILVAAGFEVIPAIGAQASAFATRLPSMLKNASASRFPLPSWLEPIREQVMAAVNRELLQIENSLGPVIQQASTRLLSGLTYVLPIILIPILAFFFLKDAKDIRVAVIGSMLDREDRTTLRQIVDEIHEVLRNYIRALVMLSIASFTAWIMFLSLMRYPYELLLAGIAGVLEFIPVFGPAAALVIILIVCAVSGSGGLIWIIVFWACYRVFQDYIFNPYLMSARVEIHPLLVLFGVLAGNNIAGIPGMFFSIPLIAILKVVYSHLRSSYTSRKQLTKI